MDDPTASALAALARETGKTRNALINQAVREMLERRRHQSWPKEVLDLLQSGAGESDLTPFESHRAELETPGDPRL